MNVSVFIAIGFIGSIITMAQFAKYCRLLNKGRGLDEGTVKHYQNMAQRYLSATGALLGVCVLAIIVGIFIS